jgi:hypothetical protein
MIPDPLLRKWSRCYVSRVDVENVVDVCLHNPVSVTFILASHVCVSCDDSVYRSSVSIRNISCVILGNFSHRLLNVVVPSSFLR